MKRIKRIFSLIYDSIKRPEMAILPGQIAFFLVLSIIPIITIIGFITSVFSVSTDVLVNFAQKNLPNQINSILIPFINGTGININIIIYTIIGLYLASNGPKAIITASNTVYGIKGYNIILKRIKAIFMTILLLGLFIFILVVIGFGNSIVRLILNLEILKNVSKDIYVIYILLKWPIAFIIIFFCVKLIYTMAPDRILKSKYVNKGALFTTILWLLVTSLYSYYATNIANYNLFYGNLSNIIILMMWIYILAYVLVVGMAINNSSYELENKK